MKKSYLFIIFAMVVGLLAACGKAEKDEEQILLPISVQLTVPETADVNGIVNMEALVTQGEEKVEDASKVEFEIWEEGNKEESVLMDAVNEKDGLYTGETSFDRDGTFHIQVHVTARNMHTMPTKTVIVGNGGHYEEMEEHAHQTEGFSMHFMELNDVKMDQENELVVHLELDGKPMENAKVRYEIWSETDTENGQLIDAKESVAGEYQASHIFTETGVHRITIYVEDDAELHEQEEHQIKVEK